MRTLAESCWNNTTSRAEWHSPDPYSSKIYLSRKIYSPITLKAEGIVIVSIDKSCIEELYQIMLDSHQGTIFIFTDENNMITGNPQLFRQLSFLLLLPELLIRNLHIW